MKAKLLVGIFLLLGLVTTATYGIPIGPFVIAVDENGNGSFTSANGTIAFTGSIITDPTSTTGSKVLAYDLPFLGTLASGDVVLTEPGTTEPADSDLIRFFTPATGAPSMLLFYSDLPGAGETADLADLGVPPAALGAKVFSEVGPEGGPNGVVYTPFFNDPGSSSLGTATFPNLTYDFISDAAVPLPASAWAGLVLIVGFGVWRVARRRPHGALRI